MIRTHELNDATAPNPLDRTSHYEHNLMSMSWRNSQDDLDCLPYSGQHRRVQNRSINSSASAISSRTCLKTHEEHDDGGIKYGFPAYQV